MAEDQDNKPKVRVIKKSKIENPVPEQNKSSQVSSSSNAPAAVVVRKRRVTVVASASSEKKDDSDVNKVPPSDSTVTKNPVVSANSATSDITSKPETKEKNPQQVVDAEKRVVTRGSTQFVLNQERPNSKQGNLADHGRNGSRGGQFRNGGGYRDGGNYRDGGSYRDGGYRDGGNRGGYDNRSRSSNFTGAQAREGYQNRERNAQGFGNRTPRDGQKPFGNRDGQRSFGNRTNGNQNGSRPGFSGNVQRGAFVGRSGGGFASPMPMEENRKASAKKAAPKKKTVYSKKDKEAY